MTQQAFTPEQQQQAEVVRAQVESFITATRDHKSGLESTYVEIGDRLAEIRTNRYWLLWGFKNFSKYMQSLESRTQNYHCLGVARDLLPFVSREDLFRIGISKASVLRAMVKGGKTISAELITVARERTKEELEGAVSKELGLVEDDEPGVWFSFGGAKMTDQEKAEFLTTMNTVVRAGDFLGEEITNWQTVPSRRKKLIMQTLCAEFLSTYAEQVGQVSSGGDEVRATDPDIPDAEGGSPIAIAA